MYERNFSLRGIVLFLAVALGALVVVKTDTVDTLWARALEIGDRAIHEVRHRTIDARDRVKHNVRYSAQQEDAIRQRISELRNGDASARRYAAWALGELESDLGVDPVIAALDDREADVRLVAAWALGEIKDQDAIEPLIESLDDNDPLVRELAVLSLGEIELSAAIDPIVGAVARHPQLAEPAIWALGEIGGPRAAKARDELFKQLGRSGWDNDQVWAGRLGTRAALSMAGDLSALIAALADGDAELRTSAAEWLGKADDERAVEPLLDALRDREPAVRAMAVWALDEVNPSRKDSHTHSDSDHANGHDCASECGDHDH